MSVLINGMKMPKDCTECKIKGEGSDSLYTWSCPFTGFEYTRYDCLNDRLDDCPLIEVPTPHGRLIDAESLEEILTTAIRNMKGVAKFLGIEDDPEIKMEIKAYTDILNGVKEQPTIIEAEGSENENNNV